MSCDDIKIQTKENITKAINLSRNILRISISEKDIVKEIINSNKTLYDLCFIGVWSYWSPPWQRIKLPDIYRKKFFKQLALHKSPDTAFAFMLNDEISEEEYAKIFVENLFFLKIIEIHMNISIIIFKNISIEIKNVIDILSKNSY